MSDSLLKVFCPRRRRKIYSSSIGKKEGCCHSIGGWFSKSQRLLLSFWRVFNRTRDNTVAVGKFGGVSTGRSKGITVVILAVFNGSTMYCDKQEWRYLSVYESPSYI